MQEIETRLTSLTSTLKSMKARCESSEFKNIFDTSFHEHLNKNIESIEMIKTVEPSSKPNLTNLKQLAEKYSQLAEEMDQKINTEIQEFNKEKTRKEELEREKKIQEEKEKELMKNFLSELSINESKFRGVVNDLAKIREAINAKASSIKNLNNPSLNNQFKELLDMCQSSMNEIETYINKNIKTVPTHALNEKVMHEIRNNLSQTMIKCVQTKDIIQAKYNGFNENLNKVVKEKEEEEKRRKAAEEAMKLKIAQEAEAKKLAEQAAANKLAQQKEIKKQQVQSVNDADKKGINSSALASYEQTREKFERIRKEVEDCFSHTSQKLYKFDLQKAINFPLNSLLEDNTSEENRRLYADKIKTLLRLLSGQTCAITTTLTVNTGKHPRAVDFCLVYLARKIVEKGEETVASRPETAFQYVQVIIEVFKHVKSFEPILMGQFQEKCSFVVPFYKTRLNGQTDDQYLEYLGYKVTNGKVEEDIHYYKRMNGVMYLYFTLLINMDEKNSAEDGLKKAWTWLANVLNMTPRPEITAEMLTIFFKCCGYSLQKAYGNQFIKMVRISSGDFFQLIKSIPIEKQSGASVGRLQTIFDQFNKTGRFAEWKKDN